MAKRRVLQFVDNDAARHGYSPSVASAAILCETWRLEVALGSLSYFCRVPSSSNLADGPSRLAFDDVRYVCGLRCERVAAPRTVALEAAVAKWR